MQRCLFALSALLFFSATLFAQPEEPLDRAKIASEVRAEFMHAWNAYKQYAWGYDVLRPLSKTGFNWYPQPLYLTPLEAFDTMVIMGFNDEADTLKEFLLKNLSFDKDMYVKNFEISIRMLGGLLTAYQLTGEKEFLELARDLGDRMLPVFRSPTGLPYVDVNLKTGAVRNPKTNPGEIATVFFEYGVLSKLTGDPKYYNTVKYALLQLFEARSPLNLVGTWIDAESGAWLDPGSHISACIDSYYEILVKAALLFDDADCKLMWKTYEPALNRYLLDTAASGIWYGHADMNTGKRTKRIFGALDAFYPAVLALAGDLERAKLLQESCYKMWTRHGLEPETFDYVKMEAVSPRFFLNPEIIESAYYLYQFTRDERYLRMGKVFFDSLKKYCRTDAGYAEIKSVLTMEKMDRTESYFYAETMKYLYLLFASDGVLDFRNIVFNTEAHPIWKTWDNGEKP
jgi:hypothetical protein